MTIKFGPPKLPEQMRFGQREFDPDDLYDGYIKINKSFDILSKILQDIQADLSKFRDEDGEIKSTPTTPGTGSGGSGAGTAPIWEDFSTSNRIKPRDTGRDLNLPVLTASRPVFTDADKDLASDDLANWISGTSNEIEVTDDGDGSVTIGLSNSVTITTDLTSPIIDVTNYLDFTETSAPPDPSANDARMYAVDEGGFSVVRYKDSSGLDHEITRDIIHIVRNDSGGTISKGEWVYVTGSNGTYPTIGKARANSLSTSRVFGVAIADISNNSFGQVMQVGDVQNLDTSAFIDGDELFLSESTAGLATATEPTSPNLSVKLGTVIKGGSVGGGIISVNTEAPLNQNLPDWIAGTANEVEVIDDGDGSVTIGLPSSVTIGTILNTPAMTLTGATASRLLFVNSFRGLESVSNLADWIGGTTNEVTVTDDGDGTITLDLPNITITEEFKARKSNRAVIAIGESDNETYRFYHENGALGGIGNLIISSTTGGVETERIKYDESLGVWEVANDVRFDADNRGVVFGAAQDVRIDWNGVDFEISAQTTIDGQPYIWGDGAIAYYGSNSYIARLEGGSGAFIDADGSTATGVITVVSDEVRFDIGGVSDEVVLDSTGLTIKDALIVNTLTSGRIPLITTSGQLTDDAGFTYNLSSRTEVQLTNSGSGNYSNFRVDNDTTAGVIMQVLGSAFSGTRWGYSRAGMVELLGFPAGNMVFGTSNATELSIGTNNSEAMKIDTSQNITFSGRLTGTKSGSGDDTAIILKSSIPGLMFDEDDATTDQRKWDLVAINGGQLQGRLLNNNGTFGSRWLRVTRSGSSVGYVEINGAIRTETQTAAASGTITVDTNRLVLTSGSGPITLSAGQLTDGPLAVLNDTAGSITVNFTDIRGNSDSRSVSSGDCIQFEVYNSQFAKEF